MGRRFALLCVLLSSGVLADAPESTPAVMKELRRVQAATLKGESDAVRLEYTRKAAERPGDPMPRVYLAWLALPSDEAWNQLKAVALIFPDNPWAHYGMGRIYVKWKMKGQARAEVDALLKRDPRFYPALMLQGELAALEEDPAPAEAFYRQALSLEEDPEARAGLGLMLLRQGKREEALDDLKRATQGFPEQPTALAALVPLLLEARDPAAATAAQRVVDLRPKDREARKALADLRFEAGDHPAATREYEVVLRQGNQEPAVLRRLAGLYRDAGQGSDEDRVLTSLAAVEPASAEAPSQRAELKLQAKDLPGAEAQLREALRREPRRIEALARLAQLLLDQGRSVDALEVFRRLRQADPASASAKAQVETLEGAFKLARRPLKAQVNVVYWVLSGSLDKFYAERRATRPDLAGKVKVKVHIGPDGVATAVDLLEDTLQDLPLVGHIVYTLRDAVYVEHAVEPVISFELGKKK